MKLTITFQNHKQRAKRLGGRARSDLLIISEHTVNQFTMLVYVCAARVPTEMYCKVVDNSNDNAVYPQTIVILHMLHLLVKCRPQRGQHRLRTFSVVV
jgi:hypothetical protein